MNVLFLASTFAGMSKLFVVVIAVATFGIGCTSPLEVDDPDVVFATTEPDPLTGTPAPTDPETPTGTMDGRFTTDGEIGRVVDLSTGKEWLQNSTAAPLAWQEAMDLCESLQMRLPTLGEMATIVGAHSPCAVDPAFGGPCETHWTLDKTKVVSAYAYVLDPTIPEITDMHVNSDHHARCVADIADGSESVHNASVNFGGKVWVAQGGPLTLFQEGAATACDELCFDGSCDWRLPTRDELVALTLMPGDGCAMPNALNGPCGAYWSSTPTSHSHLYAFQVDYETAAVDSYKLDEWAHYRCVRTPE